MRIGLRAEFNPGDILDANIGSIHVSSKHDIGEILLGHQSSLRSDGISKRLALRNRLRPDLARRIHGILRVNRCNDFRDGDIQTSQLSGSTQIRVAY